MKTNVGSIDRVLRVLIAVAASILYFTETVEGTLGYIVLAVGAIMLLTALIGFCPIYSIVGLSTCKTKK